MSGIKSIDHLSGVAENADVFIVGSGPSLDEFPKEKLSGRFTVVLNGAISAVDPWLWLFGDGRFARWGAKHFVGKIGTGAIVTNEKHTQFLTRKFPKDAKVYTFQNQRIDDPGFLHGRWTIATTGLSLAVLLKAKRAVLVGVDMGAPDGKFYAASVPSKAPGKQLDLMGQWRKWMQMGFHKELWPIPVVTTSPWFEKNCPGTPVKTVAIADVI